MNSQRKQRLLALLRDQSDSPEAFATSGLAGAVDDWSTNSDLPFQSDILTREGLVTHAHYLAAQHQLEYSKKGARNLHRRFEQNQEILEQIYFILAEAAKRDEIITLGGEWLLDNFHVIEQNVREIRKLLPKKYYRSLPRIAEGKFKGYPRVYSIAVEIIAHTSAMVDSELLYNFIVAYQLRSELSIGELWAIPIMLKLALVENLRRLAITTVKTRNSQALANALIEETFTDSGVGTSEALLAFASSIKQDPSLTEHARIFLLKGLRAKGTRAILTLQWYEQWLAEHQLESEESHAEGYSEAANQILFANSITSLKTLAALNWHDWVESVCVVDQILGGDPLGTFKKSDFHTRNRYRSRIEKLAKEGNRTESSIAQTVIELAQKSCTPNPEATSETQNSKRMNVGYYLIDHGTTELDQALGRAPPYVESIKALFTQRLRVIFYLGSIAILSAFLCSFILQLCYAFEAPHLIALFATLLFALPATEFVVGLVNWLVTRIMPPYSLPRLDFDEGVPDSARTLVAVHSILRDREVIDKTVDFLEVRFLANDDPNIMFSILADLVSSNKERLSGDQELIQHAKSKIQALNARYCSGAPDRFYLMTRKRLWNSSEHCFLSWERKRGKVIDLNRLILGTDDTSMQLQVGEMSRLHSVKYVLTLDSDTSLPRGSAKQLIGAIAHPLNRPEFDEDTGLVVKGYSLLQPRIGITLESAQRTRFSRLFSGSAGLDPYTLEVSDVYQDLFLEGSYIGKGIYDVAAFERALAGRVPENSMLSHDLFEGTFARVALCSHVELLDEYPSRYNVHSRRQHRWVRGDWQLLPWLFPRVPNEQRKFYPNPLSLLSYWKLLDNLRRSLTAPAALLFIIICCASINASPLVWFGLVFVTLSFPILNSVLDALLSPPIEISISGYLKGVRRDLSRTLAQASLHLVFLAQQSWLMLDAITRTIYRVYISNKRLLDWETHYQSENIAGSSFRSFLQYMIAAPVIALSAALLIELTNPNALYLSLPVLALWFFSPLIAYIISKPLKQRSFALSKESRNKLHDLAWDTWRYFDDMVSAETNYLPPDNVQFVPTTRVAYRTSPTNLSLCLLSIASAYDLGFINLLSLVKRQQLCLGSILKLERYNGHLFNWYDTKTLAPLHPRYISTVDNGNFVGHLIALKAGFEELPHSALLGPSHWKHFRSALPSISTHTAVGAKINGANLEQLFKDAPKNFTEIRQLATLISTLIPEANQSTLFFGELSQCSTREQSILKELSNLTALSPLLAWTESVPELKSWIHKLSESTASAAAKQSISGIEKIVDAKLPTLALLSKLNKRAAELVFGCQGLADNDPDKLWLNRVALEISQSTAAIESISQEIKQLIEVSEKLIQEIDFTFLYDKKKKLFPIGYNIEDAKMDRSFYDLLASEARLASLVAIAKGEIPQEHWFLLGRNLTNTAGGKTLLSWSATMFEYLMPVLVTEEYPGTLLYEASRSAIKAQIAYGRTRGVPWGVSESGYAGMDFEQNYQYRAFGVPGLGLKRGLSDDLVISPYSTILAMMIEPELSLKNMAQLEKLKLRGTYGFYEAVDFTPERLGLDEPYHIIESFLVHHQGMSLISLNNLLNGKIVQRRFHRDLRIRATELLLHEKFPSRVVVTIPHQAELSFLERAESADKAETTEVITTPHTTVPRTHVISNGKLSVMLDNAGSGLTVLEPNINLYRWREDALTNNLGMYIFIRDLNTGKLWSVGYQPTCVESDSYQVIFAPDKIEYRRRDFDIGVHAEITISPEDNVEIRRVSLRNYSNAPRNLEIVSYAEVALASGRADSAHPAFSKMFIESEYLPDHDALVLSRRPRSQHEKPLYLLHMLNMRVVWDKTRFETSREEFLGRGRTIANAQALDRNFKANQGTVGPVLDPIVSLRTRIELNPLASETVSFVSAAAHQRGDIEFLAQLYHDNLSINRAFEMAWMRSNIELRNEHSAAVHSITYQRLANAIFFQVNDLRTESGTIRQNRLGQSGLWKFGISGDYPIVLLRVSEPEQIKTVLELLQAQEYLRQRKVQFDLVIMNEYPDVYMRQFSSDIEAMVRGRPSGHFLNANCGVFIKNNSDLSAEDRVLFRAVARVILDAENGSLAEQLEVLDKEVEHPAKKRGLIDYLIPDFESTSPSIRPQQKKQLAQPKVEFFNGHGGFLSDSNGYSISTRQSRMTPLPWVNAISNEQFGFVVSESGCGYTWSQNSRENRLTPWNNDPVSDSPGEIIYIRDGNLGDYWSPTPLPVATDADFRVEHHFGYSTFESEQNDIRSLLTISGSIKDPVKFYHLTLSNRGKTPRRLELYLYVDLVLGTLREQSSAQIVTAFNKGAKILSAVNHYNNEFAGRTVFIGASSDIVSYTASRAEFLGRNHSFSNPHILHEALTPRRPNRSAMAGYSKLVQLSKKVGAGFESCAVVKIAISLAPNQEQNVQFFLGESSNIEEAISSASKYRNLNYRASELEKVKQYWSGITQSIKVKTPDRKLDLMLNGWLLYQTLSCRILGRSAFYQSGGAYGFRDQLQDTLAFLPTKPDLARAQILLSASRQFIEGDVQHWWHPPTGRGVRTRISDDYLWLPYVVAKYIEASGDFAILDEEISYIDGPVLDRDQMESYIVPVPSQQHESLYRHCTRAIEYGLKFGVHGLPLIGGGDWNDGMNEVGAKGQGESIWLGWFLQHCLVQFSEICAQRGDSDRVNSYREKAAQLKNAIEQHGWDGAWYKRAYFDNGAVLGSASNDECRIDSIAQSWSIISGAGDPERARLAMDALFEQLVDEKLKIILLLTPAFNKSQLEPGYIKGYLPGIRENGGQYTHAAVWSVIAAAMLGLGDKAHHLFDIINPISHADSPEAIARYKGEPFVTCGDVYSVAPHQGRAGWSWYTGSSGWLYQAGIEHILGLKVRAEYFTVEPCVPSTWSDFGITYNRNGKTFEVIIENPDGVESGVREVLIDGKPVEDHRIRFDLNQEKIAVRVVMGKV